MFYIFVDEKVFISIVKPTKELNGITKLTV